MLSQQQNDIRPKEQTAPSLDRKQPSAPPSSWRGWNLWLRVLGVVVALGAGFAFAFPIPFGLGLLMPTLLAVVSAGLLRSWWAMLIVPVAFSITFFLGNMYQMGGIDLQSWAASGFEGVVLLVVLGIVPIVICVFIGTSYGKQIEQRLQQ